MCLFLAVLKSLGWDTSQRSVAPPALTLPTQSPARDLEGVPGLARVVGVAEGVGRRGGGDGAAAAPLGGEGEVRLEVGATPPL